MYEDYFTTVRDGKTIERSISGRTITLAHLDTGGRAYDDPEMMERHDPYAALRIPSFRRFMAGAFFLNIGVGAQSVALGWEIYSRTNDPLALGFVGLITAIPMFLFILPAGYFADRLDRRAVIRVSLVLIAGTAILLAVASLKHASVAVMYLILFVDASAVVSGNPSRTAFLPRLVPRETFENAIAWRTSIGQISSVAGPAVGGVLVLIAPAAAYAMNALASITFFLLLNGVKQHEEPDGGNAMGDGAARSDVAVEVSVPDNEVDSVNEAAGGGSPAEPVTPAASMKRMLKLVFEGLLFIRRRPVILAAITLDLFAVLLGGAVYLLPIYARDILAIGETGLGFLRAAPAVGALLTALILAHRPPMERAGRNMLLAVAGFGVATIIFGLSRNAILAWAMLFLTGMFDNVSVVIRHTLVQGRTPDDMRGRVSAVSSIFIGSSNQLGGFESGLVARLVSPTFSVVSGGIGTLVVVGVTALLVPTLRKLRRLV